MEEDPPRVSRRKLGTHEISTSTPRRATRRRSTRYDFDDDDDGGDLAVDCSGKQCCSCTAGLVADCVAICCCPCAVVSFLALALVKVPWTVGRRCFAELKKKKKKKKRVQREENESEESDSAAMERDGNLVKKLESSSGFVEEEEKDENFSARFEAERIWLQLYQVGQLGFGRVSFTGNSNLWLNAN